MEGIENEAFQWFDIDPQETRWALETVLRYSYDAYKPADFSNVFHRPCDMTSDILCHQISSLSIESFPKVEEIYPLLASRTQGVQQGAFEVLHQVIPKAQEQVSFEAALSKSTVSLPDELLSLLREAPILQSVRGAPGEAQMWIGLRSYLLGWKILFDHFTHAVSEI